MDEQGTGEAASGAHGAVPADAALLRAASGGRPPGMRLPRRALWIAAVYALLATVWIYASDHALALLVPDPANLLRWSVYKGVAFVALTSTLLLGMMWRAFGAIEASNAALKASERRLGASQSQLAALIGSATDAIVTVGPDGRVLMFNAAAERLFGCAVGRAIGEPLECFLPAGMPSVFAHLQRVPGRHADGTELPLEAAVSHSRDGSRVLVTAILRDLSQREAQLAEIERLGRLYAALTRINQAIVRTRSREALFEQVCAGLVDPGGLALAWVNWQDPATRTLQLAATHGVHQDFAQTDVQRLDGGLDGAGLSALCLREGMPQICNDVARDLQPCSWQSDALSRGLLACAAFPIRAGGELRGTLSVCADSAEFFHDKELALLDGAAVDIAFALENLQHESERRDAEAAAHAEKLFSDAVIERLPGIVCVVDRDGRLLRWNSGFEQITGYSAQEIAGMRPEDFFVPAGREEMGQRIASVFEHGSAIAEGMLQAKDGSVRAYFFSAQSLPVQGRPCMVAIGIDVTERRAAEIALRELNEGLERRVAERTQALQTALHRAEDADRLKSAFLATMSHELRTPLNSIIGFTGIVLQQLAGPLTAEQSKQLGMVRNSARHLLDLINDVLDLSKIEAGQLVVRAEPFELQPSIERALESIRPLTERKDLALRLDLPPGLGTMCSDRRRIEQILLNLLTNAVKFTERGEVSLQARMVADFRPEPDAAPRAAVQLRVADTGMGIQPHDLDTLFRPFSQIDTGLTRSQEGTGLGLAICRRLVELLGGRIAVASTFGQGSEFTVILPLEPP